MMYIIHYIIALTFGFLGWQMQAPNLEDGIETISNFSKCMDSSSEKIEKTKINPDTFLLFRDFQVDLKAILTTKHPN
ncbi:MAG TPA: hypothetical protein VK050_09920 [Flavobacteriaceae bacterium]|nr:hypothetical protein [Flavobacteriaceae bacterium]